jgi:CheY-like chemotaxis protein
MAKRILIADDSVTIQKAFAMTFAGEDVSIATARSADEGLAQARQARPDLIIADGAMPGRTGYDLCAQVRADATLSGVPVYILASAQQPYDAARGTSAGADGHLLKPWDTTAFLEKVYAAAGAASGQLAVPAAPPARTSAASMPASAMEDDYGEISIDSSGPATPPPIVTSAPAAAPRPSPSSPPTVGGPPAVGGLPGVPAMRPSLIPGMRPGAMPPGRPGTLPVRPLASPPMPTPSLPPRPAAPPVGRTMIGLPAAGVPIPGVPRPAPTMPPIAPLAPAMRVPTAPIAPLAAPVAPAMPFGQPRPRAMTPMPPPDLAPPRPRAPTPAPLPRTREITPPPPVRAREATPTPPPAMVSAAVDQKLAAISAKGPEYEAIAKLSREIIEQIVWEVVPELAEAIIRERLDRERLTRA